MSDARKKVLSMLAEGKITVEESEELLAADSRKKVLTLLAAGKISVEDSEALLANLDPTPSRSEPGTEPKSDPSGGFNRNWGAEIGSMAQNIGSSFREALKQVEPPSRELKDRLKEFGGWMQNVVGSLTNEFSHIRGEPLDGMHVDFCVPAPDGLDRCKVCVIENLFGDVTVSEGSEFSLHVLGRLSKAAIEGQPPNLWFGTHGLRVDNDVLHIGLDGKSPTKAVLDLEITLPTGMILRGKSVSSSFKIKGKFIGQDFQTVSGDIRLNGLDLDEATLDTVSGDIRLEGGTVQVQTKTTSGELTIKFCHIKGLNMQSVSGDMLLSESTIDDNSDVAINTTSGDVTIEKLDGPWSQVEATTRTGDIQITWPGTTSATARQGRLVESGQSGARFRVDTVNGDIKLD